MAIKLDTTIDKIKRSIIFLAANNLITTENISVNIPSYHNPFIIKEVKRMVVEGLLLKNIKENLQISYNEMLFYWLKSEIRISYIQKNLLNNNITQTPNKKNHQQLQSAISHFNHNNIIISIKSISNYLNVCPETIRYWGGFPIIKEAKIKQNNNIHNINQENYIEHAKSIVDDMIKNEEAIYSDEVYQRIGRRRNVIVRTHPETTRHISQIIKTSKLLIKSE